MEDMTAEQAAEAAKGLTFEKVWAVIIETRKEMRESYQETQKVMQETRQETQRVMEESQKKTDKIIADLSKNIGGLGNSLGQFTESMFGPELFRKFKEFGFAFGKQAPHVKYYDENEKLIAEVDLFLEDGDYAMLVEIQTDLLFEDINEHLERIEKVRKFMDIRNEKRKLVGAVAGGTVPVNILKYAQKKGLYVILQNEDSAAIADAPKSFKAREW